MLTVLGLTFLISLLVSSLVIKFRHLHERFSADSDFSGVQKFHSRAVPRIGGVPVFIGLLAGLLMVKVKWTGQIDVCLLLLAALPAFLAGLVEDLTKRIGPMPRLLATFLSALLGFLLLNIHLMRLGIPGVDYLLASYWLFSLVFTVFAVGGVAHSMNVIDGYNGLAGVVAIFIFTALAFVAYQVGDGLLVGVALAAIGSIAGFTCFNFPRGLIFLGDGGAYLVGFLIAEISVLLVVRNHRVSPWFPLLLVAYPFFETVFSSYRKKFLRHMSPSQPDGLHLHMLIYKRMVRLNIGSKQDGYMTRRNSLTSPYLWALSLFCVLPAAIFWDNTIVLMLFFFLFVVSYVGFYQRLVRFRIPRWMIMKDSKKH